MLIKQSGKKKKNKILGALAKLLVKLPRKFMKHHTAVKKVHVIKSLSFCLPEEKKRHYLV